VRLSGTEVCRVTPSRRLTDNAERVGWVPPWRQPYRGPIAKPGANTGRVLKGERPADLRKFELVISSRPAKRNRGASAVVDT
jgi:hypothetical protein